MSVLIDIKAESNPWQLKFLGGLLLVVAIPVMLNHWWVSSILIIAGLLLIFWYSGTEINPLAKTLREYNSYLVIRSGDSKPYNQIEYIYINRSTGSEKMYTAHTLSSSTFRFEMYKAYLKLDDGTKIFLASHKNKTKLNTLLNEAFASQGIDVIDNTV